MMKWWRRLIFSIISLVLGYISLDYLYSAFTKLTNASGSEQHTVLKEMDCHSF